MVGVDDEDRVDACGRQPRVIGRTQHGPNVPQSFALHPSSDRFGHLPLNVLGVHEPIRSDPPGQPNGEPSSPGTKIRDDRTVGNRERVHDLIRPLPGVTIRRFEEPEILREKQAPMPRLGVRARAERQQHGEHRPAAPPGPARSRRKTSDDDVRNTVWRQIELFPQHLLMSASIVPVSRLVERRRSPIAHAWL